MFKLRKEYIQNLIPNMGYCFATDKITLEGKKIGYMYRETPDDIMDSGWRFFSGDEDTIYIENPKNIRIYDVNTIANYDKAIIPYLTAPIGSEYVRKKNGEDFHCISDI